MLKSFDIKNFRNLRDFKVDSLKQINLITGKNNTGKSTLLEAIAIYASKAELFQINQILSDRGETLFKQTENPSLLIENNLKSFSSLFSDRKISYDIKDSITIGLIEDSLFGSTNSTEKSISIRFVKYIDETINQNINESGERITIRTSKRTTIDESVFDKNVDKHLGLEIRNGNESVIIPLETDGVPIGYRNLNKDNFQFINTKNIVETEINGKLWDNITLSEKEAYVLQALRIIEPDIERINFIEEPRRERSAVIKLGKEKQVLPIKSMGDGINRVLTIILALVNADNGYLLIDEFENGLHYTVQEKLWEIIFDLSFSLNVQVFATTHSNDCIMGFESIINNSNNLSNGKLIRLENRDGQIREIEYNAQELKIASENNIEVR